MSDASASWGVWGNAGVRAALAESAASGRVSHAYLVAGQAGAGKKTLAVAFAKAMLCVSGSTPGEPCGQCLVCRKIDRGVHPDVQTWGLSSQIAASSGKQATKNTTLTIDTMRSMIATASLRPMEGNWRIAIVDDAELLQETAQEALLKTIEEPPSFTVILLLADDVDSLLPTIRSRCRLIELRAVERIEIKAGLRARGVDDAHATELAALANGAPGWAIAAAADDRMRQERIAAVDSAIAWAAAEPYERIVRAVKMGDGFAKDRAKAFSELSMLTGVWRDAMLIRAGQERHVHFQLRLEAVRSLADRVSLAATHAALCSVRACVRDLEANVRPRLALEHMVLQWPTS